MQKRFLRLVLPAAIVLVGSAMGLAGCDQLSVKGASKAVAKAVKRAASGSTDESAVAKLDAYTQGYNQLEGSSGLAETLDNYVSKDIPRKSVKDDIFISAGRIGQAAGSLKRGRAIKADGLAELDQAVDPLIAAIEQLAAQLKELETYYKAKAYQEDKLAKGKAQDPVIRGSFDASLKAMGKFEALLELEHKKRNAETLAKLKAEGNTPLYTLKLALAQADSVVSLFKSDGDVSNPQKYSQADSLIIELEKTLAEQRKLYAALPEGAVKSNHERANEGLTELVGSYRQMKGTMRGADFNSMVNKYNHANRAAGNIPTAN